MDLNRIVMPVFGLLFLTFLSACSGDGHTSTPSPTAIPAASAEGLWTGTIDTNRTVKALVLDDGTYWLLYYSAIGTPSSVLGFIQGNSNSQNGVFSSSSAKDFNPDRRGLLNAKIDGTYTTKQIFDGTIVYPGAVRNTFKTQYSHEYDSAPDINAIVGTYAGPVAANETVDVTVSPTGAISGESRTSPKCIFTGSATPRAQGNVFDVTITFGPQDTCSNKSATVRGVAFYDAGTKTLYSAALNDDKTNGVILIGTKNP
jgi:hypothetical protein